MAPVKCRLVSVEVAVVGCWQTEERTEDGTDCVLSAAAAERRDSAEELGWLCVAAAAGAAGFENVVGRGC